MKLLTKILVPILLILPSLGNCAPGEREWRIVIENQYQRSKEIWGTYGQTSLKTSIKKKKSKSVRNDLAANMMLKNGKMVLIQPVVEDGVTSYKVKEFPYTRKKGKRYQVALKNDEIKFLAIYKEELIAVLKKNKIDPKAVDWDSLIIDTMNCKSKKRSFNCKTPLRIKTRPNT